MSAMTGTGLRLLPWTDPDGKPCYLSSDDGNSPLSRRADAIEAVQLSMGAELLRHARALLDAPRADARELRYLADRLCEALCDVLRVAESRGARLPSYGGDDDPAVGTAPGSAVGTS
ncbi:hypothetical protein VT50_0236545 [Streptomyces antioxidans]|uniref:Uncharacterized protein n=1 Tax=Streptomyces antioxidans TaxID=1507734 RepID=A0A1V4CTP7_9ACTN|nr:hypothetical protein [Streptomyces antioxidans]OPF70473.1 hypothetical protein VT50_0236545 [Streptomyces antioxidans]